ncbi:MAG: flagellar brake protein [Burkholderiales bacterium]|nr:flagellar brake protein [Burkholderiales bacterium]
MTSPMPADDASERAADTTQILIRSREEVLRIFETLLALRAPLSAHPPGRDVFFSSQLCAVEPDGIGLAMPCAENDALGRALVTLDAVPIQSHYPRGNVEFLASRLATARVGQVPALRFDVPEFVLVRQRRAHPRIKVLPSMPVHCLADEQGPLPFDALVADISVGGLGAMVYDASITLEKGAVLRGCRLVHPGGSVENLDIEVLYSHDAVLPDGRPARMSGCRFVQMTPELEGLMQVFIADLERGMREQG